MRIYNRGYTLTAIISPGILFFINLYFSWAFYLSSPEFAKVGFDAKTRAVFWTVPFGLWLLATICLSIGMLIKVGKIEKFVSSLFFKRWFVLLWCFLWSILMAYEDVLKPFNASATPEDNPTLLIILTLLGPIRFLYEFFGPYSLEEFSFKTSTIIYSILMTIWIIPFTGFILHHLFISKYKYAFYIPIVTCFLTFWWIWSAFLLAAFE